MRRIKKVIKEHEVLCLFILLFVIYNLNLRVSASVDTIPASLLPFSILSNHNMYLDQFINYYSTIWWPVAFFSEYNGHYISIYPIVTPILITPLYVIPYMLLNLFNIPIDLYNPMFRLIVMGMEKFSAALIVSISGVFIYLSLKELVNRKTAIIGTIVYALATNTWAISSQALWQHGMVELLLSMIIYLVIINEKSPDNKNVLYMGVLSSLFVFNRPSDSILLLPLLFYILSFKDKRVFYFLGIAFLVSIPFLAYNIYYFGSIFGGYNRLVSWLNIYGMPAGLLGLLISPSRGLLVYTPIVLLSIPGYMRVSNIINAKVRNFLYISGISAVLIILMYSMFIDWHGGGCYGPRYLTCIIPAIAIYIGLYLDGFINNGTADTRKMIVAGIIFLLIVYSIMIQVIGAFCYTNGGYKWDQDKVVYGDEKYWDIHDTQIMRSINAGCWNPLNVIGYIKDKVIS